MEGQLQGSYAEEEGEKADKEEEHTGWGNYEAYKKTVSGSRAERGGPQRGHGTRTAWDKQESISSTHRFLSYLPHWSESAPVM